VSLGAATAAANQTNAADAELANAPIRVTTELPGPIARAAIAEAKPRMSPSLIHVYPLMVKRAAGCMVEDVDGNVFLDVQAGVATASTGHCHPKVAAAIAEQAQRLVHICGTDFFYPGYGELARRLGEHAAALEAKLAPTAAASEWQTFLTNSGTEGVEAAIKLARHHTKRPNLIAFRGGFHGRSLGSLSLTASKVKYRKHFGPLLPGVYHAEYGDLAGLERELLGRLVSPDEVAAIIVEPVLGEGGYVVPNRSFLSGLRALADKHGIVLVFDEVQSGMGRTGAIFAAEHFGVVPDAFVLAKGLASGMPLGALVAKKKVMTWPAGSHGSTCGGNPVCIAASLATLDLLEADLVDNAKRVGARLRQKLTEGLSRVPAVEDIRGLGLMIGVELRTKEQAGAVAQGCYERGLLVLECGEKTIRLSPPLVITEAQADVAADIFIAVAAAA
jgi:4-aminobutyrate aminotransferase